jgi:hypothetical protein
MKFVHYNVQFAVSKLISCLQTVCSFRNKFCYYFNEKKLKVQSSFVAN